MRGCKTFFFSVAIATVIKSFMTYRFFEPSRRAIERSPHPALSLFALATARAAKCRLNCELLSIAEGG